MLSNSYSFAITKSDDLKPVRDALAAGGYRAAIRAASDLGGTTELWALLTMSYYGPTGLHESRRDADGQPSAETLREFPYIDQIIQDARARAAIVLARDTWR